MTKPSSEVAAVRPGEELDWLALEAYLRGCIDGLDDPLEVWQFPNGSANLTYLLRFGDQELVLRRPPFGVVAPGAHDMKREYRVLSRLWKAFDRAPRAYVFCDDDDIIGSDFVVMERRRGEVIWDEIPSSMTHHLDVARRVGLAVVDATADLHLLDVRAADLDDLGRPEGFVTRQVDGWRKRWELVRPDDAPAEMTDLPNRLEAMLPPGTRASLVHNDLKLDNCQFDPSNPDRVQSIFDWDMATVGEPLIDLGTLLNYWPDPGDPPNAGQVSAGVARLGLPSRAEVVQHYAERTGIDVSNIGWYEAFARWKTGVVIVQLHNRWKRGESTDPRMATIADRLPLLAAGASRLLDQLASGS